MTTIIIIVVVALVFFVTICVVTFMVWKRETEMRTDSIKAIEQNLEDMLHEFTSETQTRGKRRSRKVQDCDLEQVAQQVVNDKTIEKERKTSRRKSSDPFGWVRVKDTSDKEQKSEGEFEIKQKTDSSKTSEAQITNVHTHNDRTEDTEVFKTRKKKYERNSSPDQKSEPSLENAAKPEVRVDEQKSISQDIDSASGKKELHEDTAEAITNDHQSSSVQLDKAKAEKPQINTEGENKACEKSSDETFEDEISFDFIDDQYDFGPTTKPPLGYDIGKSGKKYTASELEALIKE